MANDSRIARNGRNHSTEASPSVGPDGSGSTGPLEGNGVPDVGRRVGGDQGPQPRNQAENLDPVPQGNGPGPVGESFDLFAQLRDRLLADERNLGGSDDPARQRFPAVWQALTQRIGSTGRTKQPCSIKIEATSTGFRAVVTDLTLSIGLPVEFDRLESFLGAVEKALRNPMAPWKDLPYGERARAKKSKDSKNKLDWEK